MESDASLLIGYFNEQRKFENEYIEKQIDQCVKFLKKINLGTISEKLSYEKAVSGLEVYLGKHEIDNNPSYIKKEIENKIQTYLNQLNKTFKYIKIYYEIKPYTKTTLFEIYFSVQHPLQVYMIETLDSSLVPIIPIIMDYFK